jgi:glutamyl-tRNA synthetase
MSETLITRFAPSPTGWLHIGNARTALLNALHAKRFKGTFILRLDDTDLARSKEIYADGIKQDLDWLGITPHITVRQSDRFSLYNEAFDYLVTQGRLYPCYETPDELERQRKRQRMQGRPPIYNRHALQLSQSDRLALESEGRRPHWRFRLDLESVTWIDLIRGTCTIDCSSLSDPILRREDGTYLYTLPSVVDDLSLGITHIIRGEDHVTNTAVQIQIMKALGGGLPHFGHHNLLTTHDGAGLSKRFEHLALKQMASKGIESMAVASFAVLLGSSHTLAPMNSLEELADKVQWENFSLAPAKFSEDELAALNTRYIRELPYSIVSSRLRDMGILDGEALWLAIRSNIKSIAEAQEWNRILRHSLDVPGILDPSDGHLLTQAAQVLPPDPWDHSSWNVWMHALKPLTDRRNKALFEPLRYALTGRTDGPSLAHLLPLIHRDEVLRRLEVASAQFLH